MCMVAVFESTYSSNKVGKIAWSFLGLASGTLVSIKRTSKVGKSASTSSA